MRSRRDPEALISTITREMGFSPSTARVWKHRGMGVPLHWRAEIQSRAIRDHDIALPMEVYERFGREPTDSHRSDHNSEFASHPSAHPEVEVGRMSRGRRYGLPADDRLPPTVSLPATLSLIVWAFLVCSIIALACIGSWLLSVVR